VAIQVYVLEKCGLPVHAAKLMHLNIDYVHPRPLDELFVLVDVTPKVRAMQSTIPQQLEVFREQLIKSTEPDVKIGPQCEQPRDCIFKPICWKSIPTEKSIFQLYAAGTTKWNLFRRGHLELSSLSTSQLTNSIQKREVNVIKSGKRYCDRNGVARALQTWAYPLTYLDFETVAHAMPRLAVFVFS
jgi:hypothetical protein